MKSVNLLSNLRSNLLQALKMSKYDATFFTDLFTS